MLLRRAVVADDEALEAYGVGGPGVPTLRGRNALAFQPRGKAGPVTALARCGVRVAGPHWAFVEPESGRSYLAELHLEGNASAGTIVRRFGTRLPVQGLAADCL